MSEAVDPESSNLLGVEPIAVLCLEVAETWELVEPEMPVEVQQRMQVIQRLLAAEGTKNYGKVQRRLAKELGITIRIICSRDEESEATVGAIGTVGRGRNC